MTQSLKLFLSAVIALALATPALAQDTRKPTSSGTSTGGSATPRGGGGSSAGASSSGGSASSAPAREPQTSARPSSGQASDGSGVPSYSRPRNGKPVRGQAAERGDNPLPSRGGDAPYYGYPGYYGSNGYNSYGYYGSPYRYGYYPVYTGLGYFYYDPYWGHYDPHYGGAYSRYGTRRNDRDDRDYNIGSLRLKIDPGHGQVFVDGFYRGTVNEFDGVFERLKIEAGAHRLEVRAPGFQPLVFDVLVTPGETTTYRGDLKRQ